MSKPSSAEALAKIIEQLQHLDSEDRTRVMRAARTFFSESGEADQDDPPPGKNNPEDRTARQIKKPLGGDARSYFDQKKPKSKIEELAIAARFREVNHDSDASTQDELKAVFSAARRTFDAHNFNRDSDNARTKGFFMRGTGRDSLQLTSYGQNFVDTLPDRDATKSLGKGVKRRGGRKKASKSKS